MMNVVETKEAMHFTGAGQPLPVPLTEVDRLRALLLNLSADQSVGPCEMPMTVLYYVIQGRGTLRVGEEQSRVQGGSLVVVPAGAVRTVTAVEPMHVLLVQAL